MMLTWAFAIARHPGRTLVIAGLLIAPLLALSTRLRPDNSIEAWFVAGDPALTAYHDFLRTYGNDEAIVIGFETPAGAWSEVEVALQKRIADRVGALDGVARVLVGGSVPPPFARGVVASDGSAAAVVAWMEARPDLEALRARIVDSVDAITVAELGPSGRQAHLVGTGVLYEGLNRQTARDTGVFLSLALVMMVVFLAVGLRSVRGVVVAVLPAFLAAGAVMGLFAASGRPFTVVGSALPTLVLVIALADAVHFLLHYDRVRREAPPTDRASRRDQVARAAAWIAVPCLLTSVTTAGGFLALATSRIALVRDFGLFAAAGVMLAWVVTLVVLTALLVLVDVPARRGGGTTVTVRALDRLAGNLPRWRWRIFAGTAVSTIVLIAGIVRVRADTHTIGMLPPTHRVRTDSEWMERRLGNYMPLEVAINAPAGVRDTAFLRRVADWRRNVDALPGVGRTFSAIDVGMPPVGTSSPYIAPDESQLRVTALVPMTTARSMTAIASAIERLGAETFGADDVVHATGYLPLYSRITEYVVSSTLTGLAAAFVIVFGVMAFMIRNLRGIVAAVAANVLPLMLVFGVMGWSGIPLDIATATVGAIVLGIVVDDTIHLLHRYQAALKEGLPAAMAAAASVRDAGPSMVLSSLVIGAGFAVMIAAGTTGIAYFGLVASLAVVGALLADLLLLPELLS